MGMGTRQAQEKQEGIWIANVELARAPGHRSPKGNRQMRRILNQAANAAAKCKGGFFQSLYQRYVPRLGHKQTIGIIAHRLCRLIWKILHLGVRHNERGAAISQKSKQKRTQRIVRALRNLGYRVEVPTPSPIEAT